MSQARDRFREDFTTFRGPVRIFDWCRPEFAASRQMDDGLGLFPSYNSLFPSPESLARAAQADSADLVLGLDRTEKIVGYCLLREPLASDFFGRLSPGLLIEIAGLEVSRNYRRSHLGRRLLQIGLANETLEERIVFFVGYSWTWDLLGSGLSAGEYRRMIIGLATAYGFEVCPTNEPNVCLRPENLLMARIGSKVAVREARRFKNLLIGLDDKEE